MGKLFTMDPDRNRKVGDAGKKAEAGVKAGEGSLEAKFEKALQRLEGIVSDPKTTSPKAEGQLLILNNVSDLNPIISFFRSMREVTASSEARAAAQRAWETHTDHELIQAVQLALRTGESQLKKYPARYLELIEEYKKRCRTIIDAK